MKTKNAIIQTIVDEENEDLLREVLRRGIATPGEIVAGGWGELVDRAIIIDYDWHADDGQCEMSGSDLSFPQDGKEAAQEYVEGGEWGQGSPGFMGASVEVRTWQVAIDKDGDDVRVNEEWHTIDIEPEEPECPASEHEWTSEYEGGLRENPGVWSTGGTSMCFHSHCEKCGMSRVTNITGPQRNPGDSDTTEYGESDAAWVIANISPDRWSDWVIEQAAEYHAEDAAEMLDGYEDDEQFADIFAALPEEDDEA
jgi:hypothetical protein